MKLQKDVTHGTWDYPFQVHHTNLSNGLSLYPHIHDELEITCITSGEGLFCIDGQDYHVKTGDIVFVSSSAIHLATPTNPMEASFFSIVFSPSCFCLAENNRIYTKYVAPILAQEFSFPEYLDGSEDWHSTVWDYAKEIEMASFLENGEMLCQSALLKLWNVLFTHGCPKHSKPIKETRSARLKDSIDFMHENFSRQIKISELSSISNMSEGHFSRVFKECMKTSPMEYLIGIRLKESARLLEKSDLSIGEIALSCGFNDFSYFGKHFRKVMNCSPREYRNRFVNSKKIKI